MKKSKKILSVILALIMAFSTFAVALSATAAEAAKPEYNEVTEDDISLLFNDVNTLLSGKLNGSLFETLYKTLTTDSTIKLLFPSLGYIATWSEKYPVESMREYFSKLSDYDLYNAETEMSQGDKDFVPDGKLDAARDDIADSLTRFFAENPFPCEGIEEFRVQANGFLDFIFHNMQMNLLAAVKPNIMDGIIDFQYGFDDLCAAIGIKQDKSAASMASSSGFGLKFDYDGAAKYSKNIVNAFFPDLTEGIVRVIQALVSETEGSVVYSGLMKILGGLEKIGNDLGGDIKGTIDNIIDIVKSLPVIVDEEGNNARIDLQGIIPFVIDDVLDMGSTVKIAFDQVLFDESFDDADHDYPYGEANVEFIFKPMAGDLAKVAAAESPADAVKFVVDYLYEVVLQNKFNNKLIYRVFDGLVPSIPKDIRTIAKDIIDPKDAVDNVPMPKDDLLIMAMSLVGEMVGHHVELQDLSDQVATCVKPGLDKECWYCSSCDLYFLKSDYPTLEEVMYATKDTAVSQPEIIDALGGHEFTDVEAKEPTLNEEGNIAYRHCEKCGKNFAADADTMAADETAIEDVTVPKLKGTLGDIDNDGKINSKDVLMVKRHIAKFEGEALDEVQFALADVNADGKVDSLDTLLIMQRIAKLIDSFPAEAEPAPVEPAPAPAE